MVYFFHSYWECHNPRRSPSFFRGASSTTNLIEILRIPLKLVVRKTAVYRVYITGKPAKNDGKSPCLMGKTMENHLFFWEKLWKIIIFNGKPTKNYGTSPDVIGKSSNYCK